MGIEELKRLLDEVLASMPELRELGDRCLSSRRWGGSAVLMVVDAAFTSIGMSYFRSVVPAVIRFKELFVDTGRVSSLLELASMESDELRTVWRNRRSWSVAREVARRLISFDGEDDVRRLRTWALGSDLENWRADPIGSIKGVGLVTYQYLRMMGGVDTVMPDKVVKRVINSLLRQAGLNEVWDDLGFVREVERLAVLTGHRPVELTWMTWLLTERRLMGEPSYSRLIHLI
ncbi:MAG: hypothetical protein QW490_02560 [Nitrososphaerota archaeon]|nr:hypothetical protein [Candidatus Calditenuis fumarioli]